MTDPWRLTYEGFDPGREGLREALCTLGNGFFATRGAAPEAHADDVHYPGTYVAGCYNRVTSTVAGREIEDESLVNLPNWLATFVRVEGGAVFDAGTATLLDYRQELDLRTGVLTRTVRWADDRGHRTAMTERRLVHMGDPHLAALETTFVAENWSGHLEVESALDGRVTNSGVERYRALNGQHMEPRAALADGAGLELLMETNQSGTAIGLAAKITASCEGQPVQVDRRFIEEPRYVAHVLSLDLAEGVPFTVEKVASLYTSLDRGISEPGTEARATARHAPRFTELLEQHAQAWDDLWGQCELEFGGDPSIALVLHLHIFHLLQTVSENSIDLDAGVPARGLHGEAYRGHVFWDELFVFPFLNLRFPELTRSLLRYRYRRLPEAVRAARAEGFAGAMFPWQSGSNGREESQVVHLNPRSGRWVPDNSHRQRHVGLAIAYNVWQYYQVTGDLAFLCFNGAELIIQIARFFASLATYDRARDRYEIRGVMGPDEYHDAYPDADTPGLDNNAYTNVMAAWLAGRALEALALLPAPRRDALWAKLALNQEELDRWDDMSRKMLVVFHGDGVISQFEGYEQLKEFDWEGYRERYGVIHRLDRILEAEDDSPNAYKVSKQADVLMLFYLFSTEELRELFDRLGHRLSNDVIRHTIDYYLHRTAGGSTLSGVVDAWVMSRRDRPSSWGFFREALQADVADVQGGTTPEGIHLGAMAGTVDIVQRCYTGIEVRHDVLWLNPSLPDEVSSLRFRVRYRGHWGIGVEITPERIRLDIPPSKAAPIRVGFDDDIVELGPDSSHVFELR